ncbi:MAG: DoxX family protein [Sandarakinorhabdus sp.]|nr:DoxX family protein [Sandarakinorhabdus sp.]
MRWVMAVFYFTAGVVHIRSPGAFLPIVPDWVPMPLETVLLTGAAEIAGAIGLMVPRLRWLAGVMLAAYAVAVFPANIKHAVEGIALGGTQQGLGYHIPRLLFHPVLVWWALFAGKVINWPFRAR